MKRGQTNWFLLLIASLAVMVIVIIIIMKYSHRGNELLDYLRGLG